MMEIFEFAIQMERDGEAFYRDLALQSEHLGMRRIFNMLAADEAKHQKFLKRLRAQTRKKTHNQASVSMATTKILSNAKNIFAGITPASWLGDRPQIDLYRKAQEIERQSQTFYEEKSAGLEDGEAKTLLLQIAEEEKRHYFLLDNIINFVSRPQTWLENAEFVHLDEY